MAKSINARIQFLPELDIMEVDFSDFTFQDAADVDAFYDTLETRIAVTQQEKWFFMVNLQGCRIMPDAWVRYSVRGKNLNVRHSAGSVRYDASEETAREIARRANTENFDANLCYDRNTALARIAELREKNPIKKPLKVTTRYTVEDFAPRLSFDEKHGVMDVDFSNFRFENSADVNAFYDYIEDRLRRTGRKWYFVVNYRGTYIDPIAWINYGVRGKRINLAYSLGSVRYNTSPETASEIRARANTEQFDPNLCASHESALTRVREMQGHMRH
ncbi:MAG TPA: hypothetical protein VLA51_06180 [Paracoccaceae bacterium]|nr:hypothetical protein [Paracoccaceae bacterium]